VANLHLLLVVWDFPLVPWLGVVVVAGVLKQEDQYQNGICQMMLWVPMQAQEMPQVTLAVCKA
jgi:hypothetical protein